MTLPLLIMLTLGCVDLSRVAYTYVIVSNAARCGAEYGATHQFTDFTRPFWDSQVEQSVTDGMSQLPGFDPAGLDIHIATADDSSEQRLVTLETKYPFETIVPWPGVPAHFDLWRKVSMRQVR